MVLEEAAEDNTLEEIEDLDVGGDVEEEDASGEHGHADQSLGAVESVGPFGQCPQVGVRRFREGVADVVVQGVPDQVPVAADAAREGNELRDT